MLNSSYLSLQYTTSKKTLGNTYRIICMKYVIIPMLYVYLLMRYLSTEQALSTYLSVPILFIFYSTFCLCYIYIREIKNILHLFNKFEVHSSVPSRTPNVRVLRAARITLCLLCYNM